MLASGSGLTRVPVPCPVGAKASCLPHGCVPSVLGSWGADSEVAGTGEFQDSGAEGSRAGAARPGTVLSSPRAGGDLHPRV